ncbi:MAG: DDE-type integrase/transposase/recombinase [Pseudomonadota bacterium]
MIRLSNRAFSAAGSRCRWSSFAPCSTYHGEGCIVGRLRVEVLPSIAKAPNERWSTDLARIWAGEDHWATLARVMDCYTRELPGWHLSRSAKASKATSALEHALIARFGTPGKVETPFLLRSGRHRSRHRSGQRRRPAGLHIPQIYRPGAQVIYSLCRLPLVRLGVRLS